MLLLRFEWVGCSSHIIQSVQRRITHRQTHASRLPMESSTYQLTLKAHCVNSHSLKCLHPSPVYAYASWAVIGYYWDVWHAHGSVAYRLFPTQFPMDVLVVPWKEDGQDIRDFFSPGRSLVSMASERSMCRWWCRSVSEYPRCLILIGVRGCLHRCCGGFRVACPSRGTGSDRERLFFEHGGGSIIVPKIKKKEEKVKIPL